MLVFLGVISGTLFTFTVCFCPPPLVSYKKKKFEICDFVTKSREATRLFLLFVSCRVVCLGRFELAADALVQFDPSAPNSVTASRCWQLFGCQAAGDHPLSWHAPSAPSPRCSDWKAINHHYN